MPQNANAVTIAKVAGGGQSQVTLDGQGSLPVQGGGNSSSLNVTSSVVVKATPGRVRKLSVQTAVASGGSISICDATTVSGGTSGTQIYSGAPAGGTVVPLDWPMTNGIVAIVVSGGQAAISYD